MSFPSTSCHVFFNILMFLSLSYAECLTPTGKKNHSLFLVEYSVFSLKQTTELTTVGCYHQQTSERKVEIIFSERKVEIIF